LTTPPDPSEGREELYWSAVRAAAALGAEVRRTDEVADLKYTVAIDTQTMAAVVIDRESASLLIGGEDDGLIGVLLRSFNASWNAASGQHWSSRPIIVPVPEEDLVNSLIRCVPQYENAVGGIEYIPAMEVRPLTRNLERFKLARLSQLNSLRERHGIPSAAIIEGCPWPITPPVVEDVPGVGLVLVDGTHRVYSAIESGMDRLPMLVISGSSGNLPARPVHNWDEVQVFMAKLPRNRRYEAYRKEHFRPLRWAFSQLTVASVKPTSPPAQT
jgi:hypothetical protein